MPGFFLVPRDRFTCCSPPTRTPEPDAAENRMPTHPIATQAQMLKPSLRRDGRGCTVSRSPVGGLCAGGKTGRGGGCSYHAGRAPERAPPKNCAATPPCSRRADWPRARSTPHAVAARLAPVRQGSSAPCARPAWRAHFYPLAHARRDAAAALPPSASPKRSRGLPHSATSRDERLRVALAFACCRRAVVPWDAVVAFFDPTADSAFASTVPLSLRVHRCVFGLQALRWRQCRRCDPEETEVAATARTLSTHPASPRPATSSHGVGRDSRRPPMATVPGRQSLSFGRPRTVAGDH